MKVIKMKKAIIAFFIVGFWYSINLFAENDTIITQVPMKYRIIKGNWGLSGYLGLNLINYDNRTNLWVSNHGGPCFEVGITYKSFSLNGEFRPWTLNGNSNMVFGVDTLYNYWKYNDIKLNLVLTKDIKLHSKISVEPLFGFSHTYFIFLDEDKSKKKISIPSSAGILLGAYINWKFNENYKWYFPFRVGIRYCFEDYTKVNYNLGNNYWAMDIAFGIRERFIKVEPIYKE